MRLADLNIGEISFHNQALPKRSVVADRFNKVIAELALWRERSKQRAVLARMDEFARKDIGVSEADVWREVRKAPWQP
jgi:uncharacterized protein YjiS (DUF1127 family)